ncbi:MAG: DNA translocase FtsK [Verrucomicrobiaceae bacterium]|nr:DNA translocase FtsK [Verrucomicrobiaceae bacterium]
MNRAAKSPATAVVPDTSDVAPILHQAQVSITAPAVGESAPAPAPRQRAPRAPRASAAAAANAERPLRSRSTDEKASPWNDLFGILLLMAASMLLLALVSYDSYDLGESSPLSHTDEKREVTQNFMGTLGAHFASALLYLFGIASYVFPISLTWFGVCKLHSKTHITRLALAGVVVLTITAAILVHAMGLFPPDNNFLAEGGGGFIGGGIGEMSMLAVGRTGTLMFFGTIYIIALFMVTGLHPISVMHSIRYEFAKWQEESEQRRLIAEKLAEEAANTIPGTFTPIPEELRKKKKGDRPGAAAGSAAALAEMAKSAAETGLVTPELGLKFDPPPAPKIIDASAPRAHDEQSDKPKLTEVWEKKRAQKIEQAPHGSLGNLTVRFKDYKLPSLDLLKWPETVNAPTDTGELLATQSTIVKALASFGISVEPGDITRGPAITRYEVRPVDGLRVSRIANLDADIARATRAERINILAPIPGKDTVGIELANKEKVIVPLRELLEDEAFINGKSKLPVALGKDVYGKTIIGDLAAMPHLLVAGATGSGKSVCINSIITSLICRFAPDELRFIMIDPKVVEMQNYEELPHLALPVVTDPKKALLALRWVVKEMENRYQIFAQEGCRNFEAFNNRNRKRKADQDAKRAALAAAATAAPAANSAETAPTAEKTAVAQKAAPAPKSAAKVTAPDMAEGTDLMSTEPKFVHHIRMDEEPMGKGSFLDDDLDGLMEMKDLGSVLEIDSSDDLEAGLRDASGSWLGDSQPPPRPSTTERDYQPPVPDTLPYVVVIVDELADLMQTAPADIEVAIARITQMARAAGIHLIVATQTPRADVITGVIKANIPTRIAFQVSSALDSRVILDRKGAENLVGKGDMLYVPPGGAQPIRSQGALVTDDEIHALVSHCVAQGQPIFDVKVNSENGDFLGEGEEGENGGMSTEEAETLEDCIEVIRQEKKASTSLFQRRLRLGYGRAARMMDLLEARGIIGPGDGAKPREILVQID